MNMRYLLITFGLLIPVIGLYAQDDSLNILIDSVTSKQSEIHEIIYPIETIPEFPGGEDSLYMFVERNNNWRVGRATIVGKVFVGFIIEEDGSISNIEVMKSLNKVCDIEAKRIVSIMPKWKSDKLYGKPVRTKMILPITFDGMKE